MSSSGLKTINFQNMTNDNKQQKLSDSTEPAITYSTCYRQLFPSIKFVNEIPQWIISSNIAAYHPYSKTIYIRNNLGFKTIPILLHELSHWFIHIFLNNNQKLHNKIDKK